MTFDDGDELKKGNIPLSNDLNKDNKESDVSVSVKRPRGRPKKIESEDVKAVETKAKITVKTYKRGTTKKEETGKPKAKAKKASSSGFRLASKKLFLTYPRCPLDKDLFREKLTAILEPFGIENLAIVTEEHQDVPKPGQVMDVEIMKNIASGKIIVQPKNGDTFDKEKEVISNIGSVNDSSEGNLGQHIHVLASLYKKLDTKNPRLFDIEIDGKNYHGEYIGTKTEENCLQYLTKEIFNPNQANDRLYLSPGYSKRLGELYNYVSLENRMIALAEKGDIDNAMLLLKMEDPKGYVYKGTTVQRRLQSLHLEKIGFSSKYPFESFNIPSYLQKALNKFEKLIRNNEGKTIIIVGGAGTGKTQFLKAYFEQYLNLPTKVVYNLEDLKKFNNSMYGAILLDDPSFKKEDREQLIHLFGSEGGTLHMRYENSELPPNLVKGLTTNVGILDLHPDFCDEAIRRRVIVVQLKDGDILFDRSKTLKMLEESGRVEEAERVKSLYEIEEDNKKPAFKEYDFGGDMDNSDDDLEQFEEIFLEEIQINQNRN